ncbi:MAG TPA: PEP-CTERM sorting domain-containing protein [Pirellulales bacterium]|jgi:hypothetical protein
MQRFRGIPRAMNDCAFFCLPVIAVAILSSQLLIPAAFALPPLQPIVFSGTQAPGMVAGANFQFFNSVYFQDASGATIGPNGQIAFYGTSYDQSSSPVYGGIWESDDTGLHLVAVKNQNAAGFAHGVNYTDVLGSSSVEPTQTAPVSLPLVDASGNVAYSGYVTGLGVSSGTDEVLWQGPAGQAGIVAREGTAAPGSPGNTFRAALDYTFPSYAMNAAGNVAFSAGTQGSSGFGIWEGAPGSLNPVARAGDAAPGISGGTFRSLALPGLPPLILGPAINSNGQVAFEFPYAGPNSTVHDGVWVGSAGSLSLVAKFGDQAPGTPSSVTFADPTNGDIGTNNGPLYTFSRPEISSDNQVAIAGLLTGTGVTSANNTGIWAGAVGNLQLVARAGDVAPGVGSGKIFGNLDSTPSAATTPLYMNANGQIVFAAPYTHAGASSPDGYGIWTGTAGHLTLVARDQPTSLAINSAGQIAFADSRGIWVTDAGGTPSLVASPGELVTDSHGNQTTLYALSFASGSTSDGFGTGFNDNGQIVFTSTLNEFSTGNGPTAIFTTTISSSLVPEPSSLGLAIGALVGVFTWTLRKQLLRSFAVVLAVGAIAVMTTADAATTVDTIATSATQAPEVPAGINFAAFQNGGTVPVPPSINASGQVAFYGTLSGAGTTTTNNVGVWTGTSGNVRLTALENDSVSGLGAGINFLGFAASSLPILAPSVIPPPIPINAANQIALSANITGFNVNPSNDELLWSGSAIAANQLLRESSTTFHSNNSSVPTFGPAPLINDAGDIGFTSLSSANGLSGIWVDHGGNVQPVATFGQQAPSTASGVKFSNGTYGSSATGMNASGSVVFNSALVGPGVTGLNQVGIWAGTPGNVQLIARAGDTASGVVPQFPGQDVFAALTGLSPFSVAEINAAGTVAFSASMFTATGMWIHDSSGLKLVATDGQQVPGLPAGDAFASQAFSPASPLLNAQGTLAFQARLSGPDITAANNTAIFSGLPDSLHIVAQAGAQAPGTPTGTTFTQLALSLNPAYADIGLNGMGQVVFTAQSSDGKIGIWGTDRGGNLLEVARQGVAIQVAPGDVRTVAGIAFLGGSGNSDGRASGFSDNSQLAFWASFTDGSSGIFVSDALAVPEPTTLVLAGLGLLPVVASWLRRRLRTR